MRGEGWPDMRYGHSLKLLQFTGAACEDNHSEAGLGRLQLLCPCPQSEDCITLGKGDRWRWCKSLRPGNDTHTHI